jgi:hypothetical protein
MTDNIFDFELPLQQRVKAISLYGDQSTIKRLISILMISNSNVIKNTLFHICKFSIEIPCAWRLEIALALIDHEKYEQNIETIRIGFEALDYVCFTMQNIKDISHACKLQSYFILNNGMPFLKRVYLYMYDFLVDRSITMEYKYRIVKNMSVNLREVIDDVVDEEENNKVSILMFEYCVSLLISNIFPEKDEENMKFHILACQLGMTHIPKLKCASMAENKLLFICENDNNAANIRADAADMLLSHGCENNKNLAKNVLNLLSFDIKSLKTVYCNKENVHSETINKTALETISIIIEDVEKNSINLILLEENDLKRLIEKYFNNEERVKDSIKAYNRIVYLDNALYTNHSFTLKKIMNYIWTFINTSSMVSNNKSELEKRLIEEMIEMYNTCSSGYLVRFANIFSGFLKNGGVFIGWDEQILSIFYAKINLAIRSSFNRDIILENLINQDQEEDKLEFQQLLRTILPTIIESIKMEFKDHVSDADIDLYIRRALSVFEGYEFI